jgi:hypothetical protein
MVHSYTQTVRNHYVRTQARKVGLLETHVVPANALSLPRPVRKGDKKSKVNTNTVWKGRNGNLELQVQVSVS